MQSNPFTSPLYHHLAYSNNLFHPESLPPFLLHTIDFYQPNLREFYTFTTIYLFYKSEKFISTLNGFFRCKSRIVYIEIIVTLALRQGTRLGSRRRL